MGTGERFPCSGGKEADMAVTAARFTNLQLKLGDQNYPPLNSLYKKALWHVSVTRLRNGKPSNLCRHLLRGVPMTHLRNGKPRKRKIC